MLEYLYQKVPILKELNPKKREEIESYFKNAPKELIDSIQTVHMEKNMIFVRANEAADTIFITAKGVVRVIDQHQHGVIYDFVRVNDLWAMGSMEILLDEKKYCASLQAVSPCIMLKMPRNIFEKWVFENIDIMKREAKMMGNFLIKQDRNNRAYLFLDGVDRLSLYFLNLYNEYAKNDILIVKSSRQEMSEVTGICVRTITRAIKKLQDNGYITKNAHIISIDKKQYEMLDERISALIDKPK